MFGTVGVYRVVAPWDEGTITYDNMPDNGNTSFDGVVISNSTVNIWRTWNVTELVQEWHRGVYTNCGMVFKDDDRYTAHYAKCGYFYSSDYGTQSLRPKLIVSYANTNEIKTWVFCPDANASKDALVLKNSGDTNNGDEEYIWTRQRSEYITRTFLQFDISAIPADNIIDSAIVSLYEFNQHDPTANTGWIDVYRVTAPWDESTITWNNMPADASNSYDIVTIDTNTLNIWRSWDITELIKEWHSGDYDNNGMVFRTDNIQWRKDALYRSGEYIDRSVIPKLTVTHHYVPRGTLILVK